MMKKMLLIIIFIGFSVVKMKGQGIYEHMCAELVNALIDNKNDSIIQNDICPEAKDSVLREFNKLNIFLNKKDPGRNYSSADYRYGFNGQEMDNEVKNVTGALQRTRVNYNF